MVKREITIEKAAAASIVLRNKSASKSARSKAGSAFSQTRLLKKVTSAEAGRVASKTLRSSRHSKSVKSSTGSAFAKTEKA